MNVIDYITITCNLNNVRLQITFYYMKNVIDYKLRLPHVWLVVSKIKYFLSARVKHNPRITQTNYVIFHEFISPVHDEWNQSDWLGITTGVKQGCVILGFLFILFINYIMNMANNKITELRTIFQRESQNSYVYKQTKSVNNRKTVKTVMTLTWYRHFQRNGGLNQILRRQTSRFHYGLKVQTVNIKIYQWNTIRRPMEFHSKTRKPRFG